MKSILGGIASGLLLVLSLPKPDLYPLAWFALTPLLLTLGIESSRVRAASSSYAAGVIFFAGTFYWISETMMIYGGLSPPLAIGIGVLFSAVYALYLVLFGLSLHSLTRKFGIRALFLAPPLWVTVELLRAHLFSGFPWMLSGYALAPYAGILQMAAWTGVYGLSFYATGVNAALAYGIAARSVTAFSAAIIGVALAMFLPVLGETPSGDAVAVRLVQTNIDLDQPWTEPGAGELIRELGQLSTMPGSKPELVVWPETPAPFYLKTDEEFRKQMEGVARSLGAYFVLGYIDNVGDRPTNSAAVLSPQGQMVSRYDKIHLVPFGEYIPFKRLLFFADSLTRQVGDFTPGAEFTVSPVANHKISTAICYESIFPDLIRRFTTRGSELIVVITNDGWFGESSAPFQHLRMGVVRAVENRRYMVRTANTGISAIIDPYGRIERKTSIGERTILDGTAHFRSDQTFYTAYGDAFAYLNVLIAALAIAAAGLAGRRIRSKERLYARRVD